MKIDISGGPVTLAGKPFVKPGTDEKGNPQNETVTFKSVIADALQGTYEDERSLSGKEKQARWELAKRVYATEDVIEMTHEEAALVKKLVAVGFITPISAQVWEVLEKGDKPTLLHAVK